MMISKVRPIYRFILAHHNHRDCDHKCVAIGFGSKKYWICARCLGVYTTMAMAVGLDLIFNLELSLLMRAVIFWGVASTGWVHWAYEHMKRRSIGTPFLKTLTGTTIGFPMGLLLSGHMKHPWNHPFTFSILLLVCISATVVFLESFFSE